MVHVDKAAKKVWVFKLSVHVEAENIDIALIENAILREASVRRLVVQLDPRGPFLIARGGVERAEPGADLETQKTDKREDARLRPHVPTGFIGNQILAILKDKPFETTRGFYSALSYAKNAKISKALQRLISLGMIERPAHGIYCLTGKSNIAHLAIDELKQQSRAELLKSEAKVLKCLLRPKPEIEVASFIGTSRQRANAILRSLIRKGFVEKKGPLYFRSGYMGVK